MTTLPSPDRLGAMSRVARCIRPGGVHHVISRFVDRDWRFKTEDERSLYLLLLARALQTSDWRCLAYCLMSNHVHLAFVAGLEPLHDWARRVHSPFAQALNVRHGRLGPVFADRPAAYHLPATRVPTLLAYIHNNPVRAGVAPTAAESPWSSHRAYLGKTVAPPWLRVAEGLVLAGCAGSPARFDGLVASHHDHLEALDLSAARAAVRLNGPFEVGTPTLTDVPEVAIVARPFVVARPSVATVVDCVHARFGVGRAELGRRRARGLAGAARRVTIHAAAAAGISLSDAAAAIGVSRQRGSAIFAKALAAEEQAAVDDVVRWLGQVDKVDTVPGGSSPTGQS